MSQSQTLDEPALPWDPLNFIQGDPITAKQALGNSIVVLELWATWCPPCRSSIPHINSLQQQLAKRGVVIVGVSNETDEPKIRKFVQSMGSSMSYRVAIDSEGLMNEWQDKYRVQGIPAAFVIDHKGRVRFSCHPMDPKFSDKLDQLANELAQDKAKGGQSQSTPSFSANELRALNENELASKSIKELIALMKGAGIDPSGCIEKNDLIGRIHGREAI